MTDTAVVPPPFPVPATPPSLPPPPLTTVSIAIIGTEGAGKTVLTTVLARRLRSITDARGIYLEPQDGATLKYVEKVWSTLNDYDWPPSTAPGELFNLRWKLVHQQAGFACDFRLVDAAGQDLRRLFGDEQAGGEDLPEHLQLLAEYCRTADIVIYLVNLKDFAGEADPLRRVENESAIKSAMDYLQRAGHQKRMCLVFTQIDQYRQILQQYGTWRDVTATLLHYVFSAHVSNLSVAVMGLSAVSKTRVIADPQGIPRRVPERDFGSEGFETLTNCVDTMAQEIMSERQRQSEEEERKRSVVDEKTRTAAEASVTTRNRWRTVVAGGTGCVMGMLFVIAVPICILIVIILLIFLNNK